MATYEIKLKANADKKKIEQEALKIPGTKSVSITQKGDEYLLSIDTSSKIAEVSRVVNNLGMPFHFHGNPVMQEQPAQEQPAQEQLVQEQPWEKKAKLFIDALSELEILWKSDIDVSKKEIREHIDVLEQTLKDVVDRDITQVKKWQLDQNAKQDPIIKQLQEIIDQQKQQISVFNAQIPQKIDVEIQSRIKQKDEQIAQLQEQLAEMKTKWGVMLSALQEALAKK